MKTLILAHKEYINAMATVGRHFKPNFIIVVTPDTNRHGICYFKYLDSDSYASAEHIARINIREASRVYHTDNTGKQEWNLNSKDKKVLCNYLLDESKYRGVTNWQLLLYHWNNEHGFLERNYGKTYDSPINAFVDGFYDTEENVADPNYVASYLEMPDYTQL